MDANDCVDFRESTRVNHHDSCVFRAATGDGGDDDGTKALQLAGFSPAMPDLEGYESTKPLWVVFKTRKGEWFGF